nr:hypothetical protein [Prevotella sp.]
MSRIAHPYEEKCPYHWEEMPKALGSLGQNHGKPWAKSMVTLHIIAFYSIRTNRNVAYHILFLPHLILLKRSFFIGYAVFQDKNAVFTV